MTPNPAPILLSAALTLSLAGASAAQSAAQPAPVTVRVLSYNIRHGEGRDGRIDLQRTAEVMRRANADLIALQEVDRATERSGGVDQLAELARLLGMHAEFGAAFDFAGGEYGVAVLSRWPLDRVDNHPLPSSEHREPRTALTVRVRAGEQGPWLSFTSTHLDQGRDSDDRPAQARYLAGMLTSRQVEPSILAGDLNARTGTEVMEVFETLWANAVAVPPEETNGRRRRRGPRSDHVLFRPMESWRVVEAEILDETTASDHSPVLAVLEWVGDLSRPGGW